MTALLASVEKGGEALAEMFVGPETGLATIVGGPGTGKAAALRRAREILATKGVTSIYLEAGNDDLTPVALLNGLAAGLDSAGYRLPATDDAFREPWADRLTSCSTALETAGADGAVVLVAGVESLERRAGEGGAPGRHATDLIGMLKTRSPRLAIARTARRDERARTVTIETPDLGQWLEDVEVWGSLAPAAVGVVQAGPAWRSLPALTVRLAVALSHVGSLPQSPPATPLQAGRELAHELTEHRTTRPVWAAWQLAAHLRGPLQAEALTVLLQDLPGDVRDDDVLTRCLLFWHDGWHLHPSLREVARETFDLQPQLALPSSTVRLVGERMADYFGAEMVRLADDGELQASNEARSAAIDACAMAEDEALAESLVEEVPDPYDHIGHSTARPPGYSREAFRRALAIDGSDATAVRGLADAEDRRAVDSRAAEKLFREAIALEPERAETHVRLIGLLLAAARPTAADDAFDDAAALLSGPLEEPELAEQLFVPAARVALAAGRLSLASRAADAARSAAGGSDREELGRLVDALIETLEYGEFVAPARLGTPWWCRPAALAHYNAGASLTRWLAARVDAVEGDSILVQYADIPAGLEGTTRPERAWTTIALTELRRISVDDIPDKLPGAILEIGIYGDPDHDGTTVARVLRRGGQDFPTPELPLDRFVR